MRAYRGLAPVIVAKTGGVSGVIEGQLADDSGHCGTLTGAPPAVADQHCVCGRKAIYNWAPAGSQFSCVTEASVPGVKVFVQTTQSMWESKQAGGEAQAGRSSCTCVCCPHVARLI